jgi:hypothetical protein
MGGPRLRRAPRALGFNAVDAILQPFGWDRKQLSLRVARQLIVVAPRHRPVDHLRAVAEYHLSIDGHPADGLRIEKLAYLFEVQHQATSTRVIDYRHSAVPVQRREHQRLPVMVMGDVQRPSSDSRRLSAETLRVPVTIRTIDQSARRG